MNIKYIKLYGERNSGLSQLDEKKHVSIKKTVPTAASEMEGATLAGRFGFW